MEDATEQKEVHDSQWSEVEEEVVTLVNGQATTVKRVRKVETFLYDVVPVFDAAGNPVMESVPERRGVNGVIVRPAANVRKMHRMPRMVQKAVPSRKAVERAGKRLHWGFMADEVKSAFDKLGLDFGGYVEDEKGGMNLRPDQLIPVLWKAVQELSARIDKLESVEGNSGNN